MALEGDGGEINQSLICVAGAGLLAGPPQPQVCLPSSAGRGIVPLRRGVGLLAGALRSDAGRSTAGAVPGRDRQYERAQNAERSRRGKRRRAQQGSINVLSGAPYGYRYVRKSDTAAAYYARSATCRTGNLHGELLPVHKISQAYPGNRPTGSGKKRNFLVSGDSLRESLYAREVSAVPRAGGVPGMARAPDCRSRGPA